MQQEVFLEAFLLSSLSLCFSLLYFERVQCHQAIEKQQKGFLYTKTDLPGS